MENKTPDMEPISDNKDPEKIDHTKKAHRPATQKKHTARRRHRRENKTLATINVVLLLLVGIGLVACAYTGYRYYTFSTDDYDAQVRSLQQEHDRVASDMEALQQELTREDEQMRSDLHQAGEKGAEAADALTAAQQENDTLSQTNAALKERKAFLENIYENTLAYRSEYAKKIRQLEDLIAEGKSEAKICYWSFDDGPGAMTSAVLDFCEENGIFVTFFTSREANETGRGDMDEPALLRRQAMGGHSIQNHSNSHQYSMIAGNMYTKGIESFREQVSLQDQWVLENTGFKPGIFRFPGGSAHAFNGPLSKDQMVSALEELGYVWIDWDCDLADNAIASPEPSAVYGRAMYQVRKIDPPIAVVLSHDNYYNTYVGFTRAVPELRNAGYIFLPLFPESYAIGHSYARTWYT